MTVLLIWGIVGGICFIVNQGQTIEFTDNAIVNDMLDMLLIGPIAWVICAVCFIVWVIFTVIFLLYGKITGERI